MIYRKTQCNPPSVECEQLFLGGGYFGKLRYYQNSIFKILKIYTKFK